MAILDDVARVNLFQGLASGQIAGLAGICALRGYSRGDPIFEADTPAPGFWAVARGRVRIYRASLSGTEHILHVFGPGEAFAEVAVFEGRDYPASAQALEDSELLFFPRAAFAGLLRADPELAMRMLGLLSLRLRVFVNKIEELTLKEVPARLATHLLLLSSTQGRGAVVLDLPKGQLAAYLGSTPETLSRALKRLADEGCIQVDASRITLLDPQRLQDIAAGN